MTTPENQKVPELSPLPSGRLLKFGSRAFKSVAEVQAQIEPYAKQWHASNQREIGKSAPTWFVLGDSMAQGIGASSYDKGWVGQLQDQMERAGQHYRLINLSMSGARIEHVRDTQIPAMESIDAHPDLVTVLVGSNDVVSPRYRRAAVDNYRQMLDKLPDSEVVVSPLGDFGTAASINAVLRDYDANGKIKMTNGITNNWRGKLAQDHFHPNDLGYAEIARTFGSAILDKDQPTL